MALEYQTLKYFRDEHQQNGLLQACLGNGGPHFD